MREKNKALEAERLAKLVAALKPHRGGLWMRELARRAGMHFETARRIIESHPKTFVNYADFTKYKVNLKIIKLRKQF